jgi:hypothetical protein
MPVQLERPRHRDHAGQDEVRAIIERLAQQLDALWPAELPPLKCLWKLSRDSVGNDRVEFVIIAARTEQSCVAIGTYLLASRASEQLGSERGALDLLVRVRRRLHA